MIRAQVSTEFLAVAILALIIFVGVLIAVNQGVISYTNANRIADAQVAVNKIAEAADIVYAQGYPARTIVRVFIPPGIDAENTYVRGRTVNIRVANQDIWANSKAELKGKVPTSPGYHFILVEATREGYVLIGAVSLILDPPRFSKSIPEGQSDTQLLRIGNAGEKPLYNVTLTAHGQIANWITFSNNNFDVLPGQVVEVVANISVPPGTTYGAYTGYILAASGDESAIAYATIYVEKLYVILSFSPSIWQTNITWNETLAKSFSLCNNGNTDLTVDFNATQEVANYVTLGYVLSSGTITTQGWENETASYENYATIRRNVPYRLSNGDWALVLNLVNNITTGRAYEMRVYFNSSQTQDISPYRLYVINAGAEDGEAYYPQDVTAGDVDSTSTPAIYNNSWYAHWNADGGEIFYVEIELPKHVDPDSVTFTIDLEEYKLAADSDTEAYNDPNILENNLLFIYLADGTALHPSLATNTARATPDRNPGSIVFDLGSEYRNVFLILEPVTQAKDPYIYVNGNPVYWGYGLENYTIINITDYVTASDTNTILIKTSNDAKIKYYVVVNGPCTVPALSCIYTFGIASMPYNATISVYSGIAYARSTTGEQADINVDLIVRVLELLPYYWQSSINVSNVTITTFLLRNWLKNDALVNITVDDILRNVSAISIKRYEMPWFNTSWHFRLPILVNTSITVTDLPVRVTIDFADYISDFDPNSTRVIENISEVPAEILPVTLNESNIFFFNLTSCDPSTCIISGNPLIVPGGTTYGYIDPLSFDIPSTAQNVSIAYANASLYISHQRTSDLDVWLGYNNSVSSSSVQVIDNGNLITSYCSGTTTSTVISLNCDLLGLGFNNIANYTGKTWWIKIYDRTLTRDGQLEAFNMTINVTWQTSSLTTQQITWIMQGTTPANTMRLFYIYFDNLTYAKLPSSLPPPSYDPSEVNDGVTINVEDMQLISNITNIQVPIDANSNVTILFTAGSNVVGNYTGYLNATLANNPKGTNSSFINVTVS